MSQNLILVLVELGILDDECDEDDF